MENEENKEIARGICFQIVIVLTQFIPFLSSNGDNWLKWYCNIKEENISKQATRVFLALFRPTHKAASRAKQKECRKARK